MILGLHFGSKISKVRKGSGHIIDTCCSASITWSYNTTKMAEEDFIPLQGSAGKKERKERVKYVHLKFIQPVTNPTI